MNSQHWKDRKVLITGSSGVIGTEMVDKLAAAGARILGMDLQLSTHAETIVADLSRGVPAAAVAFEPEIVFHLAASFERSTESPDYWVTNYENNIVATHLLHRSIEKMARLSVFVFASSYLIYDPALYTGVGQLKMLAEADPIRPRNLTGIAKYLAERELDFIQQANPRFRAVSARIYRVYGRGSRDIVSRWVRAALAGEQLDAYGIDNQFDYIYAGDVADGLIELAESDRATGIVNLGSGQPNAVADILATLKRHFPALRDAVRQGGHELREASGADMRRFHELTGALPKVSLKDGIGKLIAFEESRHAAAV